MLVVWSPVSPDEQRSSDDQSQEAQAQQDAQSDNRSLVRGGTLRFHLDVKITPITKQPDQLCPHSACLALQFPDGSDKGDEDGGG